MDNVKSMFGRAFGWSVVLAFIVLFLFFIIATGIKPYLEGEVVTILRGPPTDPALQTEGEMTGKDFLFSVLFVGILVASTIWVSRKVYSAWSDVASRPISLKGPVIDKRSMKEGDYHITVEMVEFKVSGIIYEWLSTGNEVTISYWPHTKTVSRIDKVMG